MAQLDNVTSLRPDGDDFRWYLKLRCANCGEENPKWVYVTLEDKMPIKGSRGEASIVAKCHLCGRENSVDILSDSIQEYNAEDSETLKRMVIFDCRGLEPFDFSPRTGFTCKGVESGTEFKDVNLSDKDQDRAFIIGPNPSVTDAPSKRQTGGHLYSSCFTLPITYTDDEWTEYDEKAQKPVGIFEVSHNFVKA